ncbi:MAG TPA: glycosyltransferase family 2 protein, partial [Candidatus Eisenbacteria bacterium]
MNGWTVSPWMMDAINTTSFVILIYFSALQLVLFGLLILSFFDMRRRLAQNFYSDYEAVAKSHFTFPISVLVPAYNESTGVIDSVRSVLSLDYPQHEVIVINDGSTDNTMERLRQEFRLERRDLVFRKSLEVKGAIRGLYRSATTPKLTVIDKEHAGKSDALNAGLNLSRYPLFCTIDADSLFQENALLRVVRPFLEDPD